MDRRFAEALGLATVATLTAVFVGLALAEMVMR